MYKPYFNVTHEAPLCLMSFVQKLTDYDYCLVHFLPQSEEYQNFFSKKNITRDRFILMDNSLFELGESFEPGQYLHWIQKIEPDLYLVPDVFQEGEKTKKSYQEWLDLIATIYSLDTSKWPFYLLNMMGTIQGKTLEEALDCYEFFLSQSLIKKIALPFHGEFLKDPLLREIFPEELNSEADLLVHARPCFLKYILSQKRFAKYSPKPFHLLGCYLPQEFKNYVSFPEHHKKFIHSIDTSSPVIHGITGHLYDPLEGLQEKNPLKIDDIFFFKEWKGLPLDSLSIKFNIKYNIEIFQSFLK